MFNVINVLGELKKLMVLIIVEKTTNGPKLDWRKGN